MRLTLLILFSSLILSCKNSDECPQLIESGCFSFDIRQCQTDLFANDVPELDSKEQREQKLKDWFEAQDIIIEEIKLEIGFHDAVCEACDVCPQGDRYFIQLFLGNQLEAFNLLNLESEDCCEVF